jgi:type IV secretory pathway VirB3-like protein
MSDPNPRAALEDTLFLALQRPALLLGCPTEGVMANLVISVPLGGWVAMGSLYIFAYWLVMIPAIHLVLRAGVSRDYNWFRTKRLGINTKGYGTVTWGGSSVTPIPHGMPASSRDLAIAL